MSALWGRIVKEKKCPFTHIWFMKYICCLAFRVLPSWASNMAAQSFLYHQVSCVSKCHESVRPCYLLFPYSFLHLERNENFVQEVRFPCDPSGSTLFLPDRVFHFVDWITLDEKQKKKDFYSVAPNIKRECGAITQISLQMPDGRNRIDIL